jgi:DNA-binding SARP family transcriptional activator
VAGPEAADAVDAAAPGVLLRAESGTAVTLAGDVRVDLTEAVAAVRALEDVGRYRPESLDLLRHDVLPHCGDEWAVIERERFRQIRLHALESLCRRLTEAERTDEAIEVGLIAVAADPHRESARRALIEAHLAQGNISDGVAVYDDYVELMRASAGPVPAPEKVGLFQPSPAWPVLRVRRSALPTIGTLPGRRHEAPARRRMVVGSGSSAPRG